MGKPNLKQKAVKGVAWATIQKFSQILISFVSSIILARLLTPEDYGSIGMLAIFMLVSNAFVDGGFGSALIQKKRPTQEDYSTVFFWNLAISCSLYGALYWAAPFIAKFYHLPILCCVLRVQGIVIIINALLFIQKNQLHKNFCFKKLAIVQTSAAGISLIITIFLAYKGCGVWALVTQNILLSAIPAICYWTTSKWFPNFTFSKNSFKALFSFGFYALLTSLLSQIANNIQGLLIGRFFSPAVMGFYSKAHSTERLASQTISEVVSQVTYPLYSELQDDKTRMIMVIKKITNLLAFFTFPLMFVLILTAKPVFILLYSDRWLASIPYFQVLCLTGIAACLQAVNSQTIMAIGLSKIMFKWAVVKQTIGIAAVFIGLLSYGIYGLLIAIVARAWFVYFINAYLVSKHIGYKIGKQILDLAPILLISIGSCLLTYIILSNFVLNLYIDGLLKFTTFIALYFIGIYSFKRNTIRLVSTLLIPLIRNRIKKLR